MELLRDKSQLPLSRDPKIHVIGYSNFCKSIAPFFVCVSSGVPAEQPLGKLPLLQSC